ncbi:MAG: type VI secretion system tip protein TssI/VgrG [Solidesulfovibrio sp. DCME]|uniref:type VI secretion system tip protein TssI/VgrG n=1 Tax=Solidesulfovibrio sp. DCME TaxID=3447380 RepID=UPI003D11BC4C
MPGNDQTRRFDFVSNALPRDTFTVVSFAGREALSELYAFDIVLASPNDAVDLDTVIGAPAVLTLRGLGGSFDYHGIADAFELTGKADALAFYRASLVPKAHLTRLGENNRLFLDKSPQACIEEAFREAGLTPGVDFEFRLTSAADPWPSIAQFRETSFAFASRWMERDGMYSFFEQGPGGAKMVIVDDKSAHEPLPGEVTFRYATASGMVEAADETAVFDFVRRLAPLPRTVQLKDWNYETPSLDLSAEAPVLADGRGVMRFYGDHFPTVAAGRKLAEIRSQELSCRRDTVQGQTASPALTAGRLMRLTRHFSEALNQDYLITAVRHEGRQFTPLTAGLSPAGATDGQAETFYRNTFTAQPASVQFRAARDTPWPRQEGLLNAVVDGPGSGKYASLDDQGRYKVILAYDRSGRGEGKASKWIRMAQPYGGSGFGLHYPLHKGCEVALACLDGDPDRPVILGAAPNPNNKSVVTSANQTRCDLQTAGGNQIYFEDKEGAKRVLLQSKANKTFLRLGTPNDPPGLFSPASAEGQSGTVLNTPADITILCGASLSTYLIAYLFTVLGGLQELYFLTQIGINVGFSQTICGHTFKFTRWEGQIGFLAKWLYGHKDQIGDSKTELADELIQTRGRVNTLDVEVQELAQQINELSGQVDEMAQSLTELADNENIFNGQMKVVAEEKLSLSQNITHLAGQRQQTTQSNIELLDTFDEVADEATLTYSEATTLAVDRSLLFTSINTKADEFNQLSTLQIIL